MLLSMSDGMAEGGSGDVEIQLNGERQRVPRACTVHALVARLGLEDRRVAVAVNRQVVPRAEFATVQLGPGDRVEILRAVGGGR
jgi:thiamine biosynthesis protein ThiS